MVHVEVLVHVVVEVRAHVLHRDGVRTVVRVREERLRAKRPQIGDHPRGAAALQCRLLPVIDALFSEVNPIPVKAALAKMGYGTDTLRLPLTPMEEGRRAVLLNALEAWGV